MKRDTPDQAEDPEGDATPEDAAFAEYLRAADAGAAGTRAEFLARFPHLKDRLADLLDTADLIEELVQSESLPGVDQHAETLAFDASLVSGDDPDLTLPMGEKRAGEELEAGFELPYRFGDYRLERVLGQGGMGVVYLAEQSGLERPVAVKMIRSGLLAGSDEVRRFYTEARAAARLKHPNIVCVHHAGRHAGHHFFSMDYVQGTDLARRIRSGRLAPDEAARYVCDVARAIDYAHQHGVLHRDLKPANVLLDEADRVHVTDFGLAKTLDADSSLTRSGVAVGTPAYMAPEQASGYSDRAGVPADVYSLGAILFALVAGRPPLEGPTAFETLVQVMHRPAPPVRKVRRDVPVDLETIISKCLEKQPGRRYKSAALLADDLQRFLDRRPIEARPRNRLVRAGHWLADVPVFAALIGRRYTDASPGHHRLQRGLLGLTVVLPLLLVATLAARHWQASRLPAEIHIASGPAEGRYIEVANLLAARLVESTDRPCEVHLSDGSLENRERLLAGEVQLAMLQASALSGDEIAVVAPLYFEALHFLVHEDHPEIAAITDLRGRRLAVGPAGSASRLTARMVLDFFEIEADELQLIETSWSALEVDDLPEAAIVVIARGAPLVNNLVAQRYRLLPIPNAESITLEHPSLRQLTIRPETYPDAGIPAVGIATVGGPAFMATRTDAPDPLVRKTLEGLYGNDDPVFPGMIDRLHAAEWQGLALHPEARRFFNASK